MTRPKRQLPGQAVMLTRRTTQRQYLLRNAPDGATKNAMGYLFALAALRTGQIASGVLFMTNHYHAIVLDELGRRSKFMQNFHALVGKVMNQLLRRRESFWSTQGPGDTLLLDTEAIVDALLYTWLNPVEAGLVERVEDWDNFVILPKHWGKSMRFERPDYFRDDDDSVPEFIEFTPMPPPGFEDWPLPETIAWFEARIREGEDAIRAKRNGKKVLGMKKCYAVSPYATPKKSVPMFQRNPRFKSRNKARSSWAISCLRFFWRRYDACRRAFARGLNVRFPLGTISFREHCGVDCVPLLHIDPHIPRYAPFMS